jgi:hypothetical protein
MEDQAADVVGEVGEPDLYLGPHDADGADAELGTSIYLAGLRIS